jgi:hypothetical protein
MANVQVRRKVSIVAATVERAIAAVKAKAADRPAGEGGVPDDADVRARERPKARTHIRSAQVQGVRASCMEPEGDSSDGQREKLFCDGTDRPSNNPARRAKLEIVTWTAQAAWRPDGRHTTRSNDPSMRKKEGTAAKPGHPTGRWESRERIT